MMGKKLGFGLMRLPLRDADDPSTIDLEQFKAMVDVFMHRGFTYFDTAYPYHNGHSEVATREALVRRYPRDSFTLTDKLPCWLINSEQDMERIFNEQLQRCGVDYFDYYWVHALRKSYYDTMQRVGGFEFVARMRDEGKVRHIGFSFHDDPELLDQILTEHPEAEYVQLQINYLDWNNPCIQAARCYDLCVKHGKPVIVMEPVKGGALARVPQQVQEMFEGLRPGASAASWAVRYCASLPQVVMVLSGMSDVAQVEDNTACMQELEPLSASERAAVERAADIINKGISIPCTACHYCTDGCPMHIAIPEYFATYNTLKQFGQRYWVNCMTYYTAARKSHGAASDCIGCGQCEQHCPQQLHIIDSLRLVADTFEKQR